MFKSLLIFAKILEMTGHDPEWGSPFKKISTKVNLSLIQLLSAIA